jgi:hypothetical protein
MLMCLRPVNYSSEYVDALPITLIRVIRHGFKCSKYYGQQYTLRGPIRQGCASAWEEAHGPFFSLILDGEEVKKKN